MFPVERSSGEKHAGRRLSRQRGASAEPVPLHEGTTKPESKAVLVVGGTIPLPRRRSTVATEADTKVANLPEGAETFSILTRGPCARKSPKSEEVKGRPTRNSTFRVEHQRKSPESEELKGRPTRNSTFRVEHQPNQADTGSPQRTSAKPAGSDEQDTPALTGGEAVRPTPVAFGCGLRQTGQNITFSVGAALPVLECVVGGREKLEASLEARVVTPYMPMPSSSL